MIRSLSLRSLTLAAALVLPLSAQAAAPAAPAASPIPAGSSSFMVMDTDRLATEAKAMQSVFDQLAKRRDVEAAAYNMAMDKLDKEFAPIRQQRDTLDPAEYQKAVDQYNGIKAQIDGVLARVQDDMNTAAEKAIEQFNAAAKAAGEQVRQAHGVVRFLDGSAVLYIRPGSGYDATDEVIEVVNTRLPDIKVEFPARPKPAPAPDLAKPGPKKK